MQRRSRLAAYAIAVTNDQILLARKAGGSPGAGRWPLPGGGVEFGEHPEAALVREVYEESGLSIESFRYLGIDSRVYEATTNRSELHAIRMIFTAPLSGSPRVTEIDGSVDAARWVPLDAMGDLDTVDLVASALSLIETD